MDPLTHMVTGAMVAQVMSPEEQRWTFALVAAGAAVVPDIDFVARKAPGRLLFLKLHRGLTHSVLALPLIAACASGCGQLLFGTPFWPLFSVSLLAALSHLVLDTIMHSTGLQWLWPLKRRLSLPLVIGLNPLTSSARCGERSLFVCLRCSMHSAVLSPMVLLLWLGYVVSLVAPPWRLVSQLALAAGGLYILLCILLRLRARSSLLARVQPGRMGVYPGSLNPARWLGVVAMTDDGYDVWSVDALGGGVDRIGKHGPSADDPEVGVSRETATVEEFMENAIFPHATVHAGEEGKTIIWHDLAFAFSPSVSLFAARIDLDDELGVTYEEFRERWDGPPERAPATLRTKGAAQASPPA